MTAPSITMTDYLESRQDDAYHIHALAQGAVELFNNATHPPSPAANALAALLNILEEKAGALGRELDSTQRPAA